MLFDIQQLDAFPTNPGVYLMKDSEGDVIYIGKAKHLRNRVKQYFVPGRDGRPMIPYLVEKIFSIETIIVSSEKEALLLEDTLIKKHQPKYNILLKDDKSYISLKISPKQEWPTLQLVRYKGKPPTDGLYFGPYMNVSVARQLLDLSQKLFPLRKCTDREIKLGKPCFYYQIKRCPGPCAGKITKEEYELSVKRTIQFLRGQDKEVLKGLYNEMSKASDALEFEKAGEILKTITRLEKALETQQVHRIQQVDSDAISLYRQAEEVVIVKLLFRGGRLVGSQPYHFSGMAQDDDELLESFILQHYTDQMQFPKEVLLPIKMPTPLEEILSERRGSKVHVITPLRGHKSALIEMARSNAEAIFRKEKDRKMILEKILLEIKEQLHLNKYPNRIACFDISHIAGSHSVASLVVFVDGEKKSAHYRKFHLKNSDPSDDYGSMREVLRRYFSRIDKPSDMPDLILIDGGKGQLNTALKIVAELNLPEIDIAAIAKEEGRHDKGSTLERLFLPNRKDPVVFKRNSATLFLIQQIRDEAHRFAITFQQKTHHKKTIRSKLEELPGIGPVKQKRLLTHFGSFKRVLEATPDELLQVQGITRADVENLLKYLENK